MPKRRRKRMKTPSSIYFRNGSLFKFIELLLILAVCCRPAAHTEAAASDYFRTKVPDIVFIIPDRSAAYPNGLHNGILISAYHLEGTTVDVRDYGNFNQEKSLDVLNAAIATPTEQHPKVYCIWPMDIESKRRVAKLYETHNVPIIQINQLPGPDDQWEWDHLLGYAGPDDALRAHNAGIMMLDAMRGRNISNPGVVALGYPESYGGYGLSIDAFRKAIANNTDVGINIVREIPLVRPDLRQSAYNAMVKLMDDPEITIHGVYSMDDDILIGAYEALNDKGRLEGKDEDIVTLVGTVCNGARELLENGKQYGTTIQAPIFEATLAMDQATEYLETGMLSERARFTPNPISMGETWESMVIEFLGQAYAADAICTWNQYHERTTGLTKATDAKDACDYVDCLFIPNALFVAGFVMVGINYFFAFFSAIFLYIHLNKKVIQLAQPFFLALVLFGAIVDTTSILLMSRDHRTSSLEELDISCIAWPWLLTLGQMLTTATLVAKVYRVKRVIDPTRGKLTSRSSRPSMIRKTKVKTKDVSGFIIIGLIADILVLTVWYVTDPFHWKLTVTSRDFQGHVLQARGECSSNGTNAWIYPVIIVILHLALLVYANVLAFQTRKYHYISDSRLVAISLFNSIQLLVIATVMVALSDNNVSISYLIRVSYAFLNNFGVIALVVVPKLYLCVIGEGNQSPNLSTEKGKAGRISGLGDVSAINPKSLIDRSAHENSDEGGDSRYKIGSDVSSAIEGSIDSITKLNPAAKAVTFEDSGENIDSFEDDEAA